MILSDREVRAAIQRRLLLVSPCPPANDKRWSATTLDLTLDGELRPWAELGGAGADVVIDPGSADFNSNELIKKFTAAQSCEGDGYVIEPKALAPTIHPGFGEKVDEPDFPGSQIRLEIWNIGPLKVRLKKGMPICQIIFEEIHGIPEGRYAGQFAIQGPA